MVRAAVNLNSGGTGIEPSPEHRLRWLKNLVVFPIFSLQMPKYYSCLFANCFHIFIHKSS